MLRLLSYLMSNGLSTTQKLPSELEQSCSGIPRVTSAPCLEECNKCASACPTDAISLKGDSVVVDRGSCTNCNACVEECPTGTIANDRSVDIWAYTRSELLTHRESQNIRSEMPAPGIFQQSLAIRVVSTGCTACDLEISACSNPIFDLDRFGISVVASPRFADALLVTGPVPKGMHAALQSAYQAMSDPKLVIACGTCAISGGLSAHMYTEANGLSNLLPVDVFIPGCPPHPLQIIKGLHAAMRLQGRRSP